MQRVEIHVSDRSRRQRAGITRRLLNIFNPPSTVALHYLFWGPTYNPKISPVYAFRIQIVFRAFLADDCINVRQLGLVSE